MNLNKHSEQHEEMFSTSNNTRTNYIELIKSIGIQATTTGVLYLAGYFKINPAWILLLLILSIMRDKWKIEKELKQKIEIAAALRNEDTFIHAIIGQLDLPSWVHFPDVDRCEWLNRIISRLWPKFSSCVVEVLKNTIEHNINKVFDAFNTESFKFQNLILGSIPPRIGGIKVHEQNISRSEIIVDMHLFYMGNCDFSFVLFGFNGGIQNIKLFGMLRLVMKPLITSMPLFGRMEIFFLNKPQVEYDFVGVTELLNMPWLSDKLHKVIDNQIGSLMVYPNKISIIFNERSHIDELSLSNPAGVLRVNVLEARDLFRKDLSIFGKDKTDPYVVVNVGGEMLKSSHIENSFNPKWDFWAEFIIDSLDGDSVFVTVLDKEDFVEHVPLGFVSLEVNLIKDKGFLDRPTWIQLEDTQKGMIHLSMSFLELTSNKENYNLENRELPFLSSAVLVVYIDCVNNLINPKTRQLPDIVIHVVVGNVTKISRTVYSSENAVFEESFTFLVNNPEHDRLKVQLFDQKSKTKLGHLYFNLQPLLDSSSLEILNKRCPLMETASESTIVLSMRLRMLKNVTD